MITVAICLIYYGIAVWLYQMYLWVLDGRWVSIPVSAVWKVVFGSPATDRSMLGTLARWVLDWPLSLTLIVLGVGIISAALIIRRELGRAAFSYAENGSPNNASNPAIRLGMYRRSSQNLRPRQS